MIIDDSVLRVRLRKFLKVLSPEVMLRVVAARQEAWIDQNFRQEGSEKKWPPLRPSTVYARRRGSSRALQDTGRMKGSFSVRVTGAQATVGTKSRIAGFHHEGTRAYSISPTNKQFLTIPDPSGPVTFQGTKNGRLDGKRGFFSKGVRHPGLPARPLLPSKRLAEQMAERTIEAALRKANAS